MAVTVIIFAVWIALIVWRYTTESGKAFGAQQAERKAAKKPKPISQVGVKGEGGLACPKCGGTQFQPGRKGSTKIAFGAYSMLGQAKHVRCVTCGTQYVRG